MPDPQPHQFIVEEFSGRLDLYLAKRTHVSRAFIQKQIRLGHVAVNSKAAHRPSLMLRPGDSIRALFVDKQSSSLEAIAFPLDILAEDEDILVLNKPQGVVMHPVATHSGETLVHYLLHHLEASTPFRGTSPARPGIVHRLDRGTSGVLLVAKNRSALEALSLQFKNREVQKEYSGIVWGITHASGRIESTIGRNPRDRKKMTSHVSKGRAALTTWEKREGFRHFTLLSLFPYTGRTHQLRVHLTENGYPMVGDSVYRHGLIPKKKSEIHPQVLEFVNTLTFPLLHARTLTFTHPSSKKSLSFTAPFPAVFDQFLGLLRRYDAA